MTPINYVAGLLFDKDREHVALIEKQKPEWQKGLLNAIGGKIEASDESPLHAMVREFEEETGLTITDWREFCQLKFRGGLVHFFTATGDPGACQTMEEEEVCSYRVEHVQFLETVPNLKWLVPMASDKDHVTAVVEDLS